MLMLGRSDQDHARDEIAAAGKTRPVGLYHDDQNEKKKTSQTREMTPLSLYCMIHFTVLS